MYRTMASNLTRTVARKMPACSSPSKSPGSQLGLRYLCQHQPPIVTKKVNHVKHWRAERIMSWVLLGTLPIGLAFPCQIADFVMATSVVAHQQLGFTSVVTDYVRVNAFGGIATKTAQGGLLMLSAATLGGLYYLIFADIGIANTIRRIWAVKPQA